jgi:hypothetical protein
MMQRLTCLVIMGNEDDPTAAVQVLLGLPPLHVMIEAEDQARIYRLMCSQQRNLDLQISVMQENVWTWSMNPSYRWGLAEWV